MGNSVLGFRVSACSEGFGISTSEVSGLFRLRAYNYLSASTHGRRVTTVGLRFCFGRLGSLFSCCRSLRSVIFKGLGPEKLCMTVS